MTLPYLWELSAEALSIESGEALAQTCVERHRGTMAWPGPRAKLRTSTASFALRTGWGRGGIMRSMLADELGPWMEARGWTLSAEALERLEVLLGLWLRYGAVMNLTGARSRAELLAHVLDGLDTAWIVRRQVGEGPDFRWVDFGSGGGFPSLVVAAVGDWPMMLVEPRQKRVGFLELALRSIGTGSIGVQTARFERATWNEEAANGFLGEVDAGARVVSARAVWAPDAWLENAFHVVGFGGHVVLHLSGAESPEKFGARASVRSERGSVALVAAPAKA